MQNIEVFEINAFSLDINNLCKTARASCSVGDEVMHLQNRLNLRAQFWKIIYEQI